MSITTPRAPTRTSAIPVHGKRIWLTISENAEEDFEPGRTPMSRPTPTPIINRPTRFRGRTDQAISPARANANPGAMATMTYGHVRTEKEYTG